MEISKMTLPSESDLQVERAVLSDIEENAYVVALRNSNDCVVIDPGEEPRPLIQMIEALRLNPRAILITHAHWDHIGGVNSLRSKWKDLPLYIGKNDSAKLTDPFGNLSQYLGEPHTTVPADYELSDGDTINLAGLTIHISETPGHTSGHLVYRLELQERSYVFCGDLIFAMSVGRVDFPDGNPQALFDSIKTKILTLPDETKLFPGHGPMTTVGEERRSNPFLRSYDINSDRLE